jgi:hypothetical protein
MIVAVIVGLVAGSALASGAWLLFGNDGASSSPIAAPERIGDYVQQADAKPNREHEQGREIGRQRDDWDRRSSERLSESHDGAGAVVQTYADDDLRNFFALEAVRAPVAFPPYVPYTDPRRWGSASRARRCARSARWRARSATRDRTTASSSSACVPTTS